MHPLAHTALSLAGLALIPTPEALGCGHCIEDRVAAVYDHEVIGKALDRRFEVAFFALEGPVAAGYESRRFITRALASEEGIDLPSLRVSLDSASLSLAYDGKRISHERMSDTLNRRLATRGVRASLIKVIAQRTG